MRHRLTMIPSTVEGIMRKVPVQEVTLSWDTIEQMVDILALMVQGIQVRHIIGVARGGLIPATMLSHRLDAQLHVVDAKSYREDRSQTPIHVRVGEQTLLLANRQDVLIVDDIIDTGATHQALEGSFPRTPYACLVSKQPHIGTKLYVMQTPKNVWVKFPWEQ